MLNELEKAELNHILINIQRTMSVLLQYQDKDIQRNIEKTCEGLGMNLDSAYKVLLHSEDLIVEKFRKQG